MRLTDLAVPSDVAKAARLHLALRGVPFELADAQRIDRMAAAMPADHVVFVAELLERLRASLVPSGDWEFYVPAENECRRCHVPDHIEDQGADERGRHYHCHRCDWTWTVEVLPSTGRHAADGEVAP